MKHIEWSTLHQAEVIEQYLKLRVLSFKVLQKKLSYYFLQAQNISNLAVSEDLWELVNRIRKIKESIAG